MVGTGWNCWPRVSRVRFTDHRREHEQALRAFEFGVIDFVPKPFSKERLAQALQRVTERDGRAAGAAKFLAVRKHGKVELVPIDRVLYVEGAGAYAELVLEDGRRELHDKTLEKLHALLPPIFEANPQKLRRALERGEGTARPGGAITMELKNGLRLPVGRTRYKELRSSGEVRARVEGEGRGRGSRAGLSKRRERFS